MKAPERRSPAALAVGLAGALVACSAFRALNRGLPEPEPGISFYSDLGPASVDVSSYPAAQREGYAVFLKACSQCHTPARALNSPVVSRDYWELYVRAMRRRAGYAAVRPIDARQARVIVDFLDYDSRARKVARAKQFEAQQQELKRRYDALLEERARRPGR